MPPQHHVMTGLDSSYTICSLPHMEELSFKIVKIVAEHDEVVLRSSNFYICEAAFQKALFVWPTDYLQMRQGARIVKLAPAVPIRESGGLFV